MRSCPSCGGIIGRDCFNPVECAWITQSMDNQYAVDDYISEQNRKAEKQRNDELYKDLNDFIESERNDFELTAMIDFSTMVSKFLIVT